MAAGSVLAAADLRPDLALVRSVGLWRGRAGGSELGGAAALLADLVAQHRAQGVVGLAPGPKAGGEARVPASELEAGDRQLGELAGGQPDADVDDPVLLAAGDGVTSEDDDRLLLRGRSHRRDGAGANLVDVHRAVDDCLLEEEVREHRARRVLGGYRGFERDEHEPVALHRDLRAEARDFAAHRVARGLYLG